MDTTKTRPVLISLRIGRRTYDITEADRFLDNGACVHILTQVRRQLVWSIEHQIMTKKALREIAHFTRVEHPHKFQGNCVVFSLTAPSREVTGNGQGDRT